jgi:hypothetical protein
MTPDTIIVIAVALLAARLGFRAKRNFRLHRVQKDNRRAFSPAQRAQIFGACGGRCEYPRFILGRCHRKATQADHIYPWSKGGATAVENGSGLCGMHNRLKSNKLPSRSYIRKLAKARMQSC